MIRKAVIVIDYLGCLLVALAIFELADDNTRIPPDWQLPYHPYGMLVLGIVLILPMVVMAIVRARRELQLRKIAKDTAAAVRANKTAKE